MDPAKRTYDKRGCLCKSTNKLSRIFAGVIKINMQI